MIVVSLAAACGGAGSSQSGPANSANKSANNSAASARPATKVVDIPSLMGKSKDEVKKAVGTAVAKESPEELRFDFPDGKLTVSFDKMMNSPIYFALPLGSNTDAAGDSIERLGQMTGIDMKGRTPTKTDPMGTHYENETLDGKPVRIVFTPTMPGKDKFYEIRVSPR